MSKEQTLPPRRRSGHAVRSSRVGCALAVALACCLAPAAASAEYGRALGAGEATTIVPLRDPCSGALAFHHDSSFENACAWESAR